jgi:mRNA-degrading endonuclease YafQ of YafQ-DinJ toxin-antitoxin module
MKVVFSSSFERALKRRVKHNPDLEAIFIEKLGVFQKNPSDPVLRTHKLKGDLDGLRAFSVSFDLRVVFEITPEGDALFSDIGTHDEVY